MGVADVRGNEGNEGGGAAVAVAAVSIHHGILTIYLLKYKREFASLEAIKILSGNRTRFNSSSHCHMEESIESYDTLIYVSKKDLR